MTDIRATSRHESQRVRVGFYSTSNSVVLLRIDRPIKRLSSPRRPITMKPMRATYARLWSMRSHDAADHVEAARVSSLSCVVSCGRDAHGRAQTILIRPEPAHFLHHHHSDSVRFLPGYQDRRHQRCQ